MSRPLLVTGCYRSGTTLLEKLLHAHPQVRCASQPYPTVYAEAKARFLAARGLARRYPLDHLFDEADYTPADFAAHLAADRWDDAALDALFAALAADPASVWTPRVTGLRGAVGPGDFRAVRGALNAALFPEGGALVGGKEVLVCEFAPALVAQGDAVVIILRDVRDVLTSVHFAPGRGYTGADRPVLFTLRAWRKSVAFALGTEGVAWLRYEDLVRAPVEALDSLAARWQIAPFAAPGAVRDQAGAPWAGNSGFDAHDGISTDTIGRYRAHLPDSIRAFAEALCAPELRALGYPLDGPASDAAIDAYRDPFAAIHPRFPADYSHDPARLARERARLAALRGPRPDPDTLRRLFILPAAYDRLRHP